MKKYARKSFFENSFWTFIFVHFRFSKILYGKMCFVTIIEFYRKVTEKIIQNL